MRSSGLSLRCTRWMVWNSICSPAVEKNCGCVGMSTESAATSALMVSMFSDGMQSMSM